MALIPVATSLTGITDTAFTISVNADGNPVGTYYSFRVIYNSIIKYVNSSGNLQDAKIFLNVASLNTSGLIPNTLHSVALTAADNAAGLNESAIGPSSATTMLASIPVVQPYSNIFSTTVMAHWDANNNPDGTEYYVELSTDSNFLFNVFNSGWITDTGYVFTNLMPGTTYYGRVKARNSILVETTHALLGTLATKVGPETVKVIRVHNLLSELRFLITWQPNQETNVTKYKIYRSESPTDSGNFQLLDTVDVCITSYIDKVPYKFGIKFYYKVSAIDDGGNESSLDLTTPAHDETYHSFEEQPFINTAQTSDFIYNEQPVGDVDGINVLYTTEFPYRPNTVQLFLNGVRLRPVDHFIEGPLSQQITMTNPPSIGSAIRINYIKF